MSDRDLFVGCFCRFAGTLGAQRQLSFSSHPGRLSYQAQQQTSAEQLSLYRPEQLPNYSKSCRDRLDTEWISSEVTANGSQSYKCFCQHNIAGSGVHWTSKSARRPALTDLEMNQVCC